jgi:hypothetical protein
MVYQVEKVTYTPTSITNENYFLKEIIGEQYTSGDETKYRIERYVKENIQDPWPAAPDSVWALLNTNQRIVKMESNIRYVKLIFPLLEGRSWNGNSENALPMENYEVLNFNKSYYVGTDIYPQSLKVLQSNEVNKIKKNSKFEIYARNVGLVHKEMEIYEYDQNLIGQFKINSGLKYIEKLVEYGKE